MSATTDTADDGTTTTNERVAPPTDAHRSSVGRPSKLQKSSPATPAAPRDPWDALVSRMRREFFARGRDSAARYGVMFDDVLAHAIRADLGRTPGPGRVLSYVDDLVVAAACAAAHPRAWHDAWTKYEATLIRAARTRLRDADAVIFARRYWRELHASTCGGATSCPSLARFSGVRPLRVWLTDNLLAALEDAVRESLAARARRSPKESARPAIGIDVVALRREAEPSRLSSLRTHCSTRWHIASARAHLEAERRALAAHYESRSGADSDAFAFDPWGHGPVEPRLRLVD